MLAAVLPPGAAGASQFVLRQVVADVLILGVWVFQVKSHDDPEHEEVSGFDFYKHAGVTSLANS